MAVSAWELFAGGCVYLMQSFGHMRCACSWRLASETGGRDCFSRLLTRDAILLYLLDLLLRAEVRAVGWRRVFPRTEHFKRYNHACDKIGVGRKGPFAEWQTSGMAALACHARHLLSVRLPLPLPRVLLPSFSRVFQICCIHRYLFACISASLLIALRVHGWRENVCTAVFLFAAGAFAPSFGELSLRRHFNAPSPGYSACTAGGPSLRGTGTGGRLALLSGRWFGQEVCGCDSGSAAGAYSAPLGATTSTC